jgi:transposase-like protein
MSMRDAWPECGSQRFRRNGQIHNGTQNPQGKTCGRQFVVAATNRLIDPEQRTVVERALSQFLAIGERIYHSL